MLSKEELEVIELLAQAYNKFVELRVYHFMDQDEFCRAIHIAQNIVLARPALLDMDWLKPVAPEFKGGEGDV